MKEHFSTRGIEVVSITCSNDLGCVRQLHMFMLNILFWHIGLESIPSKEHFSARDIEVDSITCFIGLGCVRWSHMFFLDAPHLLSFGF